MNRTELLCKTGVLLLFMVACEADSPTAPGGAGDFFVWNGDVKIAGTLDLPSTGGPYPVMVVVPGSGTETRESDRPVVDIVVPHGIAVFRYDKRGIGQSTGAYQDVGTENSVHLIPERASDVSAIAGFLATHRDINPDQIFLFGTSQGGWVVPNAAIESENVAFIICGSGGGSSVGLSDYYDDLADNEALTIEEMTAMLGDYTGPRGYEPKPILEMLNIPALWFFGGMDRSNPTFYDITTIESIKEQSGKEFTICLLPFVNHELIDVRTGELTTELFGKLIEWAVGLLSVISDQ